MGCNQSLWSNSRCIDLIGSFDCKCNAGCRGNPRSGCTCPPSEVDGCQFKSCGANAKCRSQNGVGQCYCPTSYPHGDPNKSCCSKPGVVGCRSNNECAEKQACIAKECRNPCEEK